MDLAVQKREEVGKNGALRKQGLVPAELYGKGVPNMHIAVDAKEFRKLFKEAGESTVITLLVGKEKKNALIQDVQRDYVNGEVVHIDFHAIRMDEKIAAHVPLEFVGEAPAVKEQGGLFNASMTEIEVEALPANLPHSIKVSLESLKDLNQSLYVKDLKAPKGVEILVEPETVIATITPPQKEEEVAAPAADVAEVKVETEEKKAERDQSKEETKK